MSLSLVVKSSEFYLVLHECKEGKHHHGDRVRGTLFTRPSHSIFAQMPKKTTIRNRFKEELAGLNEDQDKKMMQYIIECVNEQDFITNEADVQY